MKAGKFCRRAPAGTIAIQLALNFSFSAIAHGRLQADQRCAVRTQRRSGVMASKSFARLPSAEKSDKHTLWYEPFATREWIHKKVNLSRSPALGRSGTAPEIRILPHLLKAGKQFTPSSPCTQAGLGAQSDGFVPLIP
jgi:hypothetical protein